MAENKKGYEGVRKELLADVGLIKSKAQKLDFLFALFFGEGQVFAKASFAAVLNFFIELGHDNAWFSGGVCSYLVPKVQNVANCMSVYSLCGAESNEGALAVEALSEYMMKKKSSFAEYQTVLTLEEFLLNAKPPAWRKFFKTHPKMLYAWTASISTEEEAGKVFQYCACQNKKAEKFFMNAWYNNIVLGKGSNAALISPVYTTDKPSKTVLKKKQKELFGILRDPKKEAEHYAAALKLAFLDAEARVNSYIRWDEPESKSK